MNPLFNPASTSVPHGFIFETTVLEGGLEMEFNPVALSGFAGSAFVSVFGRADLIVAGKDIGTTGGALRLGAASPATG